MYSLFFLNIINKNFYQVCIKLYPPRTDKYRVICTVYNQKEANLIKDLLEMYMHTTSLPKPKSFVEKIRSILKKSKTDM